VYSEGGGGGEKKGDCVWVGVGGGRRREAIDGASLSVWPNPTTPPPEIFIHPLPLTLKLAAAI
jgi:hypothetical protein